MLFFYSIASDYWRFLKCFTDKTVGKHPKCTEKNVDTITDWVREMFQGVVDLICSDYIEGSDKCEKLGII